MPILLKHYAKKVLVCFLFFLSFAQTEIIAQKFRGIELNLSDTAQIHVAISKNGSELVGKIQELTPTAISFQLLNGKVIYLKSSDIRYFRVFINDQDFLMDGKLGRKTKNAKPPKEVHGQEAIFLTNTARSPIKGSLSFKNTMLVYNTLQYSLTDNIYIKGSISPLILVNAIGIGAGCGWKLANNFHLGGGFTGHNIIAFEESDLLGLTYLNATVGTKSNFINFYLGSIFSRNSGDNHPVFSLGTSQQVNKSWILSVEGVQGLFVNDFDFEVSSYLMVGASFLRQQSRFNFALAMQPYKSSFNREDYVTQISVSPFLSYSYIF